MIVENLASQCQADLLASYFFNDHQLARFGPLARPYSSSGSYLQPLEFDLLQGVEGGTHGLGGEEVFDADAGAGLADVDGVGGCDPVEKAVIGRLVETSAEQVDQGSLAIQQEFQAALSKHDGVVAGEADQSKRLAARLFVVVLQFAAAHVEGEE